MQTEVKAAAKRGLYSAALASVQDIVLRIIPARSPQPVARATYKQGWRAYATDYGAVFLNIEQHAAFIEHGVKNARIGAAAIEALAEWVVRKNIATPAQAVGVAFYIGKRLTQRGIFGRGQGLGIQAEANSKLPDLVRKEVTAEIRKAMGV